MFSMNIIVVGCGKIGTEIIASLVSEGHDVVALDSNAAALSHITDTYDVMGVCGNGADCDILSEAGIENTDIFVAVTGLDELNMLSCLIAKRMGAKHTVARIRNPEYNDRSLGFMKKQLDLSVSINPELMAAQELFNILKFPGAVKIEPFAGRNFEMVEIILKDGSPLDCMPLSMLRDKFKEKLLVCVVQRGDKVYIPDGSFVLKSGDKLGITATPQDIHKFLRSIGVLQKQARNVMLLGASRTTYYLAKLLCNIGTNVKILDRDEKRCRMFSEALPKAVVIHGDGAQQELLLEEGINTTDAFVSLTGMDEENILISIFAASQNVPKVISKVNRNELSAMAQRLGLDCIVSPHKTISNIVVRYARALQNSMGSNVETLYKLMDGQAEALEFNVKPDSRLVNIPLKDLELKNNILIAGIIRERRSIIPNGDDVILSGDHVVVIATGHQLKDLSDILK